MHIQLCTFGSSLLLAITCVQATSFSSGSTSSPIDCLENYQVPYFTSESADWTAYQTPFNLRLPYTPAIITVPTNEAQVSASITCAAAASLKVQAKGGGHSYASFSSGGQNGSLIIDMENFSVITVDQSMFNFTL